MNSSLPIIRVKSTTVYLQKPLWPSRILSGKDCSCLYWKQVTVQQNHWSFGTDTAVPGDAAHLESCMDCRKGCRPSPEGGWMVSSHLWCSMQQRNENLKTFFLILIWPIDSNMSKRDCQSDTCTGEYARALFVLASKTTYLFLKIKMTIIKNKGIWEPK